MQPLANSIAAIKARTRGEAPATAKNDASPANLDEPYEYIMHVFDKHIKPVIESGTYESDGFGPVAAAYLDAALAGAADRPPPGCDRVRSMLCLAAKLKARCDAVANISGSGDDWLLYAISNAMTWLTHFADRDLAMFAAVLMQKVLRLPVSPDKVPHHFWGYVAPSMRHGDKMAMMRVGMALEKIEAWLAGRYESGGMDWIFKMPDAKGNHVAKANHVADPDTADSFMSDVVRPVLDGSKGVLNARVKERLADVLWKGADYEVAFDLPDQVAAALFLVCGMADYHRDIKDDMETSAIDTRNYHDRLGHVLTWIRTYTVLEVQILASNLMFAVLDLYCDNSKLDDDGRTARIGIIDDTLDKGEEWMCAMVEAAEFVAGALPDAGESDAPDLTDSKTRAGLRSQLDGVLEPYGLRIMDRQFFNRICDGGIAQVDFDA